jgi:hypothetical protein
VRRNNPLRRHPKSVLQTRHPVPKKRGVGHRHERWDGLRWTRQRQAREGVRRAVIRERARRAGRTALKRTAKPCGPDTRGWCQAAGGEVDPTGSISHQAGSDGGKTNSSPGRARHKPSNHCAGNAGVLRLYLYARVRLYSISCTRDRGCSKHPAFPAPSVFRGKGLCKARAQCVAGMRTCISMTAERGTL